MNGLVNFKFGDGEFRAVEVLSSNAQDGFTCILAECVGGNGFESTAKAIFSFRQIPMEPNTLANVLEKGSLDSSITQDSGAEYSYHLCKAVENPTLLKLEVINPCSQKQIDRARHMPLRQFRETPEFYREFTLPYIQECRKEGSLQWLYNILDGTHEQEMVLFASKDIETGFTLSISPKWNTPSAETADNFQALAMVARRDLASLRDLTDEHLPLLYGIRDQGLKVLQEKFGLTRDRMRIYIHYLPQFFHFHVHFCNLAFTFGLAADRAHLLDDVIYNIEQNPTYYSQNASMTVNIPQGHVLEERI